MPPSLVKTRQSHHDHRVEYLGTSKELAEDDLPTIRSCLRYGMLLREQNQDSGDEIAVDDMAKGIYARVAALYFKANAKFVPPLIFNEKVSIQKLIRYWNDVTIIIRRQKGFRTVQKRIDSQLDKLFDIIYCKCSIICVKAVNCSISNCSHMRIMSCQTSCGLDNCPHKQIRKCVLETACSLANCSHINTSLCNCVKEMKLPPLDLSFVRAQRYKVGDKCAYQMGKVDKRETKKQMDTLHRKEKDLLSEENAQKKVKLTAEKDIAKQGEVLDFFNEIPDEIAAVADGDEDFEIKAVDKLMAQSMQNRISFPTVAGVSLRYGASDRMTAAIATAALIDAGLVTEIDSSKVLDHHKVHREKLHLMSKLRLKADEKYKEGEIRCILADGRKNWTNVMEKDEKSGKYYQSRVKMEHISVTSEPGGEYLFHFVPPEATKHIKAAKQIAIKIVEWMEKYGVNETLDSLGGDSTNSNTGWQGGSFTLIEKMLGEKKTWLVCFLHLNELPLRHLLQDLDGKTNSDHTFSGPIGKSLDNAVNLEINPKFSPIQIGPALIELDQSIIDDLSTDQKYGYRMVMAIRAGKVSMDLANMDIGPICHSRWLTTANRLLRTWVGKHGFKGKDLASLKMIVEFIVGVYYPIWFEVKVKHNFIDGPRHLLKQMELTRLQKKKVQGLVAPHIARSAWWSHSEAVLQTLLCSEDKEERRVAVDVILKLRDGKERGDLSNRARVHADTFNPQAKKVSELCSWEANVHEPVFTCSMSLDEIRELLETPMVVPYRPVHGQSMERVVKEVTRACEAVYGEAARDGFIRAGVANRQVMPMNRTKKDLVRMAGT